MVGILQPSWFLAVGSIVPSGEIVRSNSTGDCGSSRQDHSHIKQYRPQDFEIEYILINRELYKILVK